MKDYVPLHQPIIWTGLKNLTPMFLSIDMTLYFSFNAWMEYRGVNHPYYNVIDTLMQWL